MWLIGPRVASYDASYDAAMKMNIVFTLPENAGDYESGARPVATFYAELLGMEFLREDWYIIAESREAEPHLAFGDGPGAKPMPRWPDPDYPQQLHLDVAVPDLEQAAERAMTLGATRLDAERNVYADPVGHPFCLYPDAVAGPRLGRVVIDCPEPASLAAFYAELLDMPVRLLETPERIVIGQQPDQPGPSLPAVAFQRVTPYLAPRWPDPAYPQQLHFDLWPDDYQRAEQAILRLGATRLPAMGGSAPVYADPVGHPFCLCGEGQ